jgi:hypothetical protein
MTCKRCGSFAINHHCHGRDGTDKDLCDVCFWRKRAEAESGPGIPEGIAPRHITWDEQGSRIVNGELAPEEKPMASQQQ